MLQAQGQEFAEKNGVPQDVAALQQEQTALTASVQIQQQKLNALQAQLNRERQARSALQEQQQRLPEVQKHCKGNCRRWKPLSLPNRRS